EEIAATGAEGVIAGHCGLPFTRRVGQALWHNAGAIGMPADDGTPRGWFSVLAPEAGGLRVSHHALHYAHEGAARAMREAGLAEGYAAALENGDWPSEDVLPDEERARRGQRRDPPSLLWN
ncbi:MAG TPA: radical SAM protein, partial [Roseococcus sp.]|nr:radical SAM protein [Roseococcus sp.]